MNKKLYQIPHIDTLDVVTKHSFCETSPYVIPKDDDDHEEDDDWWEGGADIKELENTDEQEWDSLW